MKKGGGRTSSTNLKPALNSLTTIVHVPGTPQEIARVKDAAERGVSFEGRSGHSLWEEAHDLRQEIRQLQKNLWHVREEKRLKHQSRGWHPPGSAGGSVVQSVQHGKAQKHARYARFLRLSPFGFQLCVVSASLASRERGMHDSRRIMLDVCMHSGTFILSVSTVLHKSNHITTPPTTTMMNSMSFPIPRHVYVLRSIYASSVGDTEVSRDGESYATIHGPYTTPTSNCV